MISVREEIGTNACIVGRLVNETGWARGQNERRDIT